MTQLQFFFNHTKDSAKICKCSTFCVNAPSYLNLQPSWHFTTCSQTKHDLRCLLYHYSLPVIAGTFQGNSKKVFISLFNERKLKSKPFPAAGHNFQSSLNHINWIKLKTGSLPGNFNKWSPKSPNKWFPSPLFLTGKPSTKQESMGHFQKPQWIPTLHHNQCLRHRGKRCFGTETSRVGEMSEFASGRAGGGLSNRSLTESKWTVVETKCICTDA